MAKLKADWLKEAKALNLTLTVKDTLPVIKQAVEAAQAKSTKVASVDSTEQIAKAGKRSKKGVEQAEVKAEKEARKKGDIKAKEDTNESPKGPIPKTRARLEKQSRRFQAAAKKIDKTKDYGLKEALELAVVTAKVKFDATVELHIRLNADPKQADQNIREVVILPSGSGKAVRVAVFAEDADQKKAVAAGADLVGEKEIIDLLSKEQINFDVLIATPQLMSQLGRFAKTLGPKGLMPNPKSGTVSKNVATAVKQAKAGRVEFRIDKDGIIHVPIGKASFGVDKLEPNLRAILSAIKSAKPTSIKGPYIISAFLSSSMGPSVRLSTNHIFDT